jgi:small GTP-binding protein
MMTSIVLEGPIAEIREREVKLLTELAELVAQFGPDAETDRQRILKNAADLRDMFFMVVIVGEFNAGKSTFVNALLGDELLPMGITPTTEAIEIIRYGDKKSTKPNLQEGEAVRNWTHPNTGSPGVVIVDTPGTGSVFAKHEKIAKDFLSRSDLVLFLISAKKAFAQTERMYMEMARDYGKKIIIVINQIDLLEAKERKEVVSFVKQQVSELLNLEPPIFTVSAKNALKAEKRAGGLFRASSGVDDGQMSEVRQHLLEIFERVSPAKQKLEAQLDFSGSILKKYQGLVENRLKLVGADRTYVEQLRAELSTQAEGLNQQLNTTMSELDRVFDALLARGKVFVSKNLTLGATLRAPDKDQMREKFEKEVVSSSLSQIADISENYVGAVVDSSRRYWRNIIERLNKLEALMEQEIGKPDAGSYADQRIALQEAIAIADAELKTYTERNLAESLRANFALNMSRFSLSITGLVGGIIAIILGTAAPGAVTATVLGVVGAVVLGPILALGGTAGVLLYGQKLRRDANQELETRLQALRESYRQSLLDMTERERTRLLQYGQQILGPVFSQIEVLVNRYQGQATALNDLRVIATQLRADLDNIVVKTV